MRSGEDFRVTVRRGAKAVRPHLVAHVVLPDAVRRPGPVRRIRREPVRRFGRRPQPGEAPAPSPDARRGSTELPDGTRVVVRALPAGDAARRRPWPTTSKRALRPGGGPMKYVLVGLLQGYRFAISPLYGQVCRYHPTCSAYALEAVQTHGACAAPGWRCGGSCAATPGPPAASTRYPPQDRTVSTIVGDRPASRTGELMGFLSDIGSAIMTPLYYAVSAILLAGTGCSPRSCRIRLDLGAGHRRPDRHGPRAADPAVRQADQVEPEHAAAAAADQGAAEEVRPRPGEARPGDR